MNEDQNPNGVEPPEPPQGVSETDSLKEELKKAQNDHLYLRAEFENFRKNTMKERSDWLKYGAERLIVDLLNVLDNFTRARQVELTPQNLESFKKGMDLVAEEFKQTLARFGVQELQVQGQKFDPNFHEALASQPSADTEPGKVLQVFRNGYKLHDKLIRPAQVVISASPSGAEKEQGE